MNNIALRVEDMMVECKQTLQLLVSYDKELGEYCLIKPTEEYDGLEYSFLNLTKENQERLKTLLNKPYNLSTVSIKESVPEIEDFESLNTISIVYDKDMNSEETLAGLLRNQFYTLSSFEKLESKKYYILTVELDLEDISVIKMEELINQDEIFVTKDMDFEAVSEEDLQKLQAFMEHSYDEIESIILILTTSFHKLKQELEKSN